MPKIATLKEISDEEAVDLIRKHIAALPPPPKPKFEIGDAVRLDTGCIGVVHSIDEYEGTIYVCYLDEDGTIHGPSYGWDLERL